MLYGPFLRGTCSILKVFEMAVLVSVCQGFRKVEPFERGALEAGRVDDARRWVDISVRVWCMLESCFGIPCWGMCWDACVGGGVPKSLLFIEGF
ncbi:hypothetical protein [Bartonella sp. AP281QHHD]|uniref:hypothetical protein n=1 Tax=Bartonella sp. AP281QHHD TaxID=3243481 RepID=UPI0035CEA016